jgi:hypothetical protein
VKASLMLRKKIFSNAYFKFNGIYNAFSTAKEHFAFHTLDFEMIEELKCAEKLLTEAK